MFRWLKQSLIRPAQNRTAQAADPVSSTAAHIHSASAHHIALGDQCLRASDALEAARHYRKAIAIEPQFADAHRLLGDALREQGELGEAALCYRKALEFAPDLADAHYGLGVTLLEKSNFHNATVSFRNALELRPNFVLAHNGLGFALLELGQRTQALACFQKTIRLDPENGMALHLAASLTGINPDRAPTQYVEKLFDGFAGTFDTQLQQLGYDTPKNLVALITQRRPECAGNWNVLDLGCGTGLVGLEIAPFAQRLTGVDLSAKMLEKARARNLYHRLIHGDLVTAMRGEAAASCDVIVAADTFIYLGKLDETVREVKRLLGVRGLFAFSVEALEALPGMHAHAPTADYRLQAAPSCRYAHSSQYLSRLASDHHLALRCATKAHLRDSVGTSVSGYLVLMENLASTHAA